MKLLLTSILSFLYLLTIAQQRNYVDLKDIFDNHEGCFVLYDVKNDRYIYYNDSICKIRYSPCSTFKIPNSLIALESGVANDENYMIEYDSIKIPSEPWMLESEPFKYWLQDHSLKTAFKNSVVWYYQELAARIGAERMNKYINLINYGNKDISSGVDEFWLCGSMQISANEQVEFLKKLYSKQLIGFSERSQQIVKGIMLYESTDKYKLYGKTGGGDCWENKVIGWYVGFLEANDNTYIFAMNIKANNFSYFANNKRITLTKEMFKILDIIH